MNMRQHLLSIIALGGMMMTAASAAAQTTLYSNDYENQTVGTCDKTWRQTNWTDYNRLSTITIEQDDAHGKYVKILPRGNGSSGVGLFRFRDLEGASSTKDPLNLEAQGITSYTLEFDAAISATCDIIEKPAGSGNYAVQGAESEIAIANSSATFPKRFDYGFNYDTGADNEWNNVFYFKMKKPDATTFMSAVSNYDGGLPYLNMDVEGTPEVTLPIDGSWSHFKFDVDATNMTVNWSVTPATGSVISGSYTSVAENLILYGIYFRVSSGAKTRDFVAIDNIKVTTGGDATGINEVTTAKTGNDYYTISGIKVKAPTKGIYIHNGKKVVIK